MTRRSHHLYIFRLDAAAAGISRDRFLEALIAEGVPASKGWYRPLYANGVFRNAHLGPAHGISAPLAGRGVDYSSVSCPVCEQVCADAVWLPQTVLLAPDDQLDQLTQGIAKVLRHADRLASGN